MTKFASLGLSSDEAADSRPIVLTLIFQPSPTEPKTILISRVDPYNVTFPLFLYTFSKEGLQLARIGAGSAAIRPTPIGNAKFHNYRSTELLIQGQTLEMEERDAANGYKLDHPQLGKLKWHYNEKEKAHVLEDASEARVARCRPGPGDSVVGCFLDVYILADDMTLDLFVLFTLAMIAESDRFKDELEGLSDAADVLQALGGGGS